MILKSRKYPENNLRYLREKRGLTLEELAALIEPPASHGMIQKLELGERELRLEWKKKLSLALRCSVGDFYVEGESQKKDPANESGLSIAREQLDTAIDLWLKDNADSVINTLALSAYNIIQDLASRDSEENDIDNPITKSPTSEQIIWGCVIGLILIGEKLTHMERVFYCWYLVQRTKSFPESSREILMQLLPRGNGEEIRKLDKRRFFHAFSAERT